MLYQYLWFIAFALALVPTSLLLGFIRLPVDSPRPVALEIRASPVVRCPAAINDSALKGQVSFSDSHMGDAFSLCLQG